MKTGTLARITARLHIIRAAFAVAFTLLGLPFAAHAEIRWTDTFRGKDWPTSSAVCVQGEAEARTAELRRLNPGILFRYRSINISEFDPDAESFCQFVIERRLGTRWITVSTDQHDHLAFGGSDPCPLGSTDSSGVCMPKNAGLPSCPENDTDPIDSGTGNRYESADDYSGFGAAGLLWRRHYNSLTTTSGPLGNNWRHDYQRSIVITGVSGDAANAVKIYREDGKRFEATLVGSAWQSPADVPFRLTQLTSTSGAAGWRLTTLEDDVETYDSEGQLVSIATRSGLTQTLAYDSAGRLTSVTDSHGRQLTFGYDANNRISAVNIPGAAAITYTYDSANRLQTVGWPDATSLTYVYNESTLTGGANLPNALTGIIDESGTRFASFTYDTQLRATRSEQAGGANRVTVAYGSGGSRTITDALNTARTFTYTTVLGASVGTGVSSLTFACGPNNKALQYDANRNVSVRRDYNDVETHYSYDLARDLETSRTEGFGTPRARTIATQYHATYRLPTQIDEPGRRTSLTYDANGNLLTRATSDTSVTPALSRTWTYTYNTLGQVLTVDGPRTDASDVTTFTYHPGSTGTQSGNVQTITNAAGQVVTFNTYNAHGQPLTITDTNGVVTTLVYDARQRLTSLSAAGETTSYTYWPTGLLRKVTFADASFIQYTYDGAHRLTRIQDGLGNRIDYTLDARGNVTAENAYDPTSVLARTHTRVFNGLSQLWKSIGAAGTTAVTASFSYDNNGNPAGVNGPLGRNYVHQYDELNRLKQITDPTLGVTQLASDALDQLSTLTDPLGHATSYTINALGDLTQQTSPDTGSTASTYDAAGNLATRTDARGKTGTFGYDVLNRLTSISLPDLTTTFSFDAGANGTGRLTGASDANHSLAFGYDALGRVTSKTQTVGSVAKAVSYGYTSGNLTSLVTPSGQTIGYTYTDGRVTGITLNGATTILDQVLYEPFGPTSGWRWGNGTFAVRVYDADGKPTTIDSAGSTSYGYDDAFRITSITDLGDSTKSWTYGYDLIDRVNAASRTSQTIGFTYDANGNRLSQSGTQTGSYSIASTSNRLSSITGTPARAYTYDAAGNTTSDGTNTYTYNDAGRLSTVTRAGVTTTFIYDALGQRVKKSNSASTRYFVYDELGHLLGEYDASGALVEETVWLNDTPVATLRSNGSGVSVFYVHTDHLDTPRRISRPGDNAIVWRWDSDPFGTTLPNEDADGDGAAFAYHLRFPGQYFDVEDGLSSNGYRDFDPVTGRYVEADPLGQFGGLNVYSYVGGQPISAVDPLGLARCTLVFFLGKGQLDCSPDDPQNAPVSIPVASGNNVGMSCKNNPECQAKSNRGPIPSGCWQWTGGFTSKPNGRVLEECKGAPATGRSLIRSHSCSNPFGPSKNPKSLCSEGCITGTVSDIQKLNKLLDAEPGSILYVAPARPSFSPDIIGPPQPIPTNPRRRTVD